ncbi:MAG: GDP-mannose 4,6-dehydratase, partial [Paracoccaceae bacterium]
NPTSIYATSKLAADFLTMNYHDAYGLPTVTTRMILLMAGIVVRQGTGGLLMAAEMSIPAVLIAGWVSWTALRDLRKGGED